MSLVLGLLFFRLSVCAALPVSLHDSGNAPAGPQPKHSQLGTFHNKHLRKEHVMTTSIGSQANIQNIEESRRPLIVHGNKGTGTDNVLYSESSIASKKISRVPCFADSGSAATKELTACSQKYLSGAPDPSSSKTLPWPLYVNHASRHSDRKVRFLQIMSQNGIEHEDVVWLDKFDSGNISEDVYQCILSPRYGMPGKAVTYATYSLYFRMLEQNIPVVAVMEDDPQFLDEQAAGRFRQNLLDLWMQTEAFNIRDGFDLIFFGGCQGIHASTPVNGSFFKADNMWSRCANGYFVSQQGARKMLAILRHDQPTDWFGIRWPIDWMFDSIGKGETKIPGCDPLNVFLVEPPLYDNSMHEAHLVQHNIRRVKASNAPKSQFSQLGTLHNKHLRNEHLMTTAFGSQAEIQNAEESKRLLIDFDDKSTGSENMFYSQSSIASEKVTMRRCVADPSLPSFWIYDGPESTGRSFFARPELNAGQAEALHHHRCRVDQEKDADLALFCCWASPEEGRALASLPVRSADRPYLIYAEQHFSPDLNDCKDTFCTHVLASRPDFIFTGLDLRDFALYDNAVPALPGVTLAPPHHAQSFDPDVPPKYFLTFRGGLTMGLGGSSFVREHLQNAFGSFGNQRDDVKVCIEPQCSEQNFPSYNELMNTSFALCPRGHGRWSYRFSEIIESCAIPVVLSDGLNLPFETVIDWSALSIRIPEGTVSGGDAAAAQSIIDRLPKDEAWIRETRQNICKVKSKYFDSESKRADALLASVDVAIERRHGTGY